MNMIASEQARAERRLHAGVLVLAYVPQRHHRKYSLEISRTISRATCLRILRLRHISAIIESIDRYIQNRDEEKQPSQSLGSLKKQSRTETYLLLDSCHCNFISLFHLVELLLEAASAAWQVADFGADAKTCTSFVDRMVLLNISLQLQVGYQLLVLLEYVDIGQVRSFLQAHSSLTNCSF